MVVVLPTLIVDLGADTIICPGDSIMLDAGNPGLNYLWSTGDTTQTLTISNSGTYWVSVVNGSGCTGSDTVYIQVDTCLPLVANFTISDTAFCEGDCINLTDLSTGNPTSWQWTFNAGTPPSSSEQNPIDICFLTAGTYTIELIVTNTFGADTSTLTIQVYATPVINIGNDASINLGDSIILNATGTNGTYTWSPPDWLSCVVCPSTISTPDETITYYVTISDSNGCEAMDSITITVDVICGDVFVPNIFSPNGDEQNDVLYVYGACIETINFIIYDRWGELVYEANSVSQAINVGWNGKFKSKGIPLNPATFVYALKITFKNGDEHFEKGNIALVR